MGEVMDTDNMGVELRTKAVKDVDGRIWLVEFYVDPVTLDVHFVSFELWMEGEENVAQIDTTTTP